MQEISHRRRVWAALKKSNIDRPPKGEILIDQALQKQLPAGNLEAILAYLDADLVTLPINEQVNDSVWNYWQQQDYFVFGLLQGPFTLMLQSIGWQELSYLIVKNPGKTRKIMQDFLQKSFLIADRALTAGCEGIILADDLAGNRGMLISPAYLREHYFTLLTEFLDKLNSRDIPFVFHSDGNMLDIVPMLKAAGFWGIQCLQPSAGITRDSFSNKLLKDWVFWGNFEFEGEDCIKSADQVNRDIQELRDNWSSVPGYM
ncbi:MAG: uroporphyrinogen decarboxylase family protein, partial [Syntrophomonadaceae bacterium]|nr:uroporphyrinogen decarboxylase family protein [Syntrophomonadaceae bacterium]